MYFFLPVVPLFGAAKCVLSVEFTNACGEGRERETLFRHQKISLCSLFRRKASNGNKTKERRVYWHGTSLRREKNVFIVGPASEESSDARETVFEFPSRSSSCALSPCAESASTTSTLVLERIVVAGKMVDAISLKKY